VTALGRLLDHDPRSLDWPAERAAQVKSVHWERRSPVLDQGRIGACVGFSAADWLATDNAARKGRGDITNDLGLKVYSVATHLDRFKGVWQPDDTGTAGLYGAKALVKLGLTAGKYRHAFGLQHTLEALQAGPVMLGIAWKTGCDTPARDGLIRWTGEVRGGHEVLIDAVDLENERAWICNHWTATWAKGGRACLPLADLEAALKDRGDVTVPS